jgi:hypothetical protein
MKWGRKAPSDPQIRAQIRRRNDDFRHFQTCRSTAAIAQLRNNGAPASSMPQKEATGFTLIEIAGVPTKSSKSRQFRRNFASDGGTSSAIRSLYSK